MREALAAAASGRLVLAVMNTLSATDTVAALIDRFEPHQQTPISQTLGRVLRGVICQRLVDRADARGRVAVVESLVGTQKVRDAIQQAADPAVLERLMTEGDYHGMATFDQALFHLFSDETCLPRRGPRARRPPRGLPHRRAAGRTGHPALMAAHRTPTSGSTGGRQLAPVP